MGDVRGTTKGGSIRHLIVYEPGDATSGSNIALNVAKTITSRHNQHITLLMVGQPGSGKSWAALDLGYQIAWYTSRIIEGKSTPHSHWLKYFNLDHMAIITLSRVAELLDNLTRHGVYILDDIGVGYSARDWQSGKNKSMNDIIQTFRTDNSAVIYTVPDRSLIDKVPRSLVERYMEFEKAGGSFSVGVNLFRYMNITNLKRDNKQIFAYDVAMGLKSRNQYVRHMSRMPPERLRVPYEVLRRTIAMDLRKEKVGELTMIDAAAGIEPGAARKLEVQQEHAIQVQQVESVDRLRDDGKAIDRACELVGLADRQYRFLKSPKSPQWFQKSVAPG